MLQFANLAGLPFPHQKTEDSGANLTGLCED